MSGVIINFDTLKQIMFFSKQFINLDTSVINFCVKFGYDEQTTKKILLLVTLMPKAKNWCSKDADLQAKVAGVLIFMYNLYEDEIKERLQGFCERCLEDTQGGGMSEAEYKYRADLLMGLNKIYDTFDDIDTDYEPSGEWFEDDGKTLLKLNY
jgi:hypothetical protein